MHLSVAVLAQTAYRFTLGDEVAYMSYSHSNAQYLTDDSFRPLASRTPTTYRSTFSGRTRSLFSPATTVPFSGKSFRLGADVVDENAGTVTLPDGDLPREAEIGFGSVNGDSPVLQRIIEEDYAAIESQRRELIKRAESCAFIGGGWAFL